MDWSAVYPRIMWKSCSRRLWPRSRRLAFSAEQAHKPRHVLLTFWAGRGVRHIDAQAVSVTPGCCHWSRPGPAYSCEQDPDAPLGITALHFELYDARGQLLRPDATELPPEVLAPRHPELLQPLTEHIAHVAHDLTAGARVGPLALQAAESLFRGLILDLVAAHSPGPAERGATDIWSAATRQIQENLAQPPSVAELAEQFGYSRSHFSREFGRHVGLSPQQYIMNARLGHARQLLLSSDLAVQQVALETGYGDVFSFSRHFKRHSGLAPSVWRRQHAGGDPGPRLGDHEPT